MPSGGRPLDALDADLAWFSWQGAQVLDAGCCADVAASGGGISRIDAGKTPRCGSAASVFQRLQFGNGLWHSATVFETNASFVTADADLSAVDIAAQRESAHALSVAVVNWGELVEHGRRHDFFAADVESRACNRLAG